MDITTPELISTWFDQGVNDAQAYMVIWCDTFDYTDFPEFFPTRQAAIAALDAASDTLRAMECYDLNAPKRPQLAQYRCWAIASEAETGRP